MKTGISVSSNGNRARLSSEPGSAVDFERLLEWARLGVAYIRKDSACLEKHRQSLKLCGEVEERLLELDHWRQSLILTEREKAALSVSEIISLSEPEEISHQVLLEARCRFTTDEMVRLMLVVMAVNEWIDLHAKSPIRVLVVEDSPEDQELLLHQLRKNQMADHVLFMPNAYEALEWIEDARKWAEWNLLSAA